MVIILFLIFMPAGVRIACNGRVHVTSKCLSRRRLRPGEEALKQLYLSLSEFPDISKIRTGMIWIQMLRY
jgi:hypothetical protein